MCDIEYFNACKDIGVNPNASLVDQLLLYEKSCSTFLTLESTFVGPRGFFALAAAVSLMPRLTVINLTGNSLSDICVEKLCDAIVLSRAELRVLDLSNNKLTNSSATLLLALLRSTPSLTTVSVDRNLNILKHTAYKVTMAAKKNELHKYAAVNISQCAAPPVLGSIISKETVEPPSCASILLPPLCQGRVIPVGVICHEPDWIATWWPRICDTFCDVNKRISSREVLLTPWDNPTEEHLKLLPLVVAFCTERGDLPKVLEVLTALKGSTAHVRVYCRDETYQLTCPIQLRPSRSEVLKFRAQSCQFFSAVKELGFVALRLFKETTQQCLDLFRQDCFELLRTASRQKPETLRYDCLAFGGNTKFLYEMLLKQQENYFPTQLSVSASVLNTDSVWHAETWYNFVTYVAPQMLRKVIFEPPLSGRYLTENRQETLPCKEYGEVLSLIHVSPGKALSLTTLRAMFQIRPSAWGRYLTRPILASLQSLPWLHTTRDILFVDPLTDTVRLTCAIDFPEIMTTAAHFRLLYYFLVQSNLTSIPLIDPTPTNTVFYHVRALGARLSTQTDLLRMLSDFRFLWRAVRECDVCVVIDAYESIGRTESQNFLTARDFLKAYRGRLQDQPNSIVATALLERDFLSASHISVRKDGQTLFPCLTCSASRVGQNVAWAGDGTLFTVDKAVHRCYNIMVREGALERAMNLTLHEDGYISVFAMPSCERVHFLQMPGVDVLLMCPSSLPSNQITLTPPLIGYAVGECEVHFWDGTTVSSSVKRKLSFAVKTACVSPAGTLAAFFGQTQCAVLCLAEGAIPYEEIIAPLTCLPGGDTLWATFLGSDSLLRLAGDGILTKLSLVSGTFEYAGNCNRVGNFAASYLLDIDKLQFLLVEEDTGVVFLRFLNAQEGILSHRVPLGTGNLEDAAITGRHALFATSDGGLKLMDLQRRKINQGLPLDCLRRAECGQSWLPCKVQGCWDKAQSSEFFCLVTREFTRVLRV